VASTSAPVRRAGQWRLFALEAAPPRERVRPPVRPCVPTPPSSALSPPADP